MSLRTRLVAGLLVLAAVGLVLLAGVTYAEQRHFLYDRVDQQAKAAVGRPLPFLGGGYPGYRSPSGPDPDHDGRPGDGAHMPAGPAAGTWTYDRTASGLTSSSCRTCYSTSSAPTLPAKLNPEDVVTVKGPNGTHYRVASRRNADGSFSAAAVPLTESDAILRRLLRIEA